MSQFQLFPPPAPEVKMAKNPFRRGDKNPPAVNVELASPISLDEIQDSSKAESVLLQIIEDTTSFPPPPSRPHNSRSKSPSVGKASPSSQSPESPQSPRNQSRQGHKSTARGSPSQGSMSNSSSSEHSVSSTTSPQSSQSSVSPIQMKSMFPRLDPKLLLNHQIAQTQLSSDAKPSKKARRPHLTLATSSEIDDVLGPKTVPASVLNFPNGIADSEEIRYSTPYELEVLWEAANGQRPQNLAGIFNLHLARTGPATFTFGNSQLPLYTLQTFENDELSITRGNPSKPNSDVPIMTLSLEDRGRREHPHDGLVALLFSRLAAMLAIEQADEISKLHHLAPSEAADVENQALRRAAAQESCRLSWNRNSRLYELRHPLLSKRQPPALVGAEGIPLSPVRSQSLGILYITVSAPSSDATPYQAPTILVTGPPSSTALAAAQQAANPRTSTLPLADSDEPLASLDFTTRTLTISPAAVITTIPSLYAIDSLIAAMLAVAVSDEATNPILADMELQSPRSSEPGLIKPGVNAPYRGPLITTQAEREDFAESLQLAAQIEAVNSTAGGPPRRKSFFKFWDRSQSMLSENSRATKKGREIEVEEFDLEKYGRYGKDSSREGEKLPGITRTLLRILFFGLNVLVQGLTLMVKILAWLLVHSTRCVTSEKF